MKKICFIFLFCILAKSTFSQNTLVKAVKLYYRVNPFDRKFSAMLTTILSDTGFVKTGMNKRTDSNFFFLSGYYKRFNPFDFKTTRTELRLAENEIVVADTGKLTDTIIIYQVLGIAGTGEDNKQKVRKEFEKFNKRFSYDFFRDDYKEAMSEGLVSAAMRNYYVQGRSIPAMTVAWGKMPGEDNYVFSITLRLKIIENFADLPKTPGEF
jgi:hypothetical protein